MGTEPSDAGILPHERTLPKARSDRLALLRATRANLDPIWGLSLADGLTAHLPLGAAPLARATDAEGVTHELWRLTDAAVIAADRAPRSPRRRSCWPTVTTASRPRRNYRRERPADDDRARRRS